LIALCEGRSCDLLVQMVCPRRGVVSKCKFLPSVAEVREWLDKNEPPAICRHPEHRLLLPEPELKITEEERLANVAKIDALLAKWGKKSRFPRPRKHQVATQEEINEWGKGDG
jgi:hypothetical protein